MALLNVQNISQTGLAPAFVACSVSGDSFSNNSDESTFIHVKNIGGAACTVTVTPFYSNTRVNGIGSVTISPISVVVPATTGERMIGPFPSGVFSDPAGNVNVNYSSVASLAIAAIRVVPVGRG
jgi:hypothetical protein